MRKLVMPFARQMMLCGYRNPEYAKPKAQGGRGYPTYGVDMGSTLAGGDGRVSASGEGVVSFAGFDGGLDGVVGITYKDAYNHKTGKTQSLVARYMHLTSIHAKKGQAVTAGTFLGDDPIWVVGSICTSNLIGM